jgi:prevent-host-death family protein
MKTHKLSATQAKLQFGSLLLKVKNGTPVIIEKNNHPEIVCISVDDYEDFLEIKDEKLQKSIEKGKKEIEKGEFYTLDDLYEAHRKTIKKEAKNNV